MIITREMLRTMRKGSVIVDFAIDHGGCAESSRPTTLDPSYIEDDVVHYCVPTCPVRYPAPRRTAFNNAAWGYIRHVAAMGVASAVAQNEALRRGLVLRNGELIEEPSSSYAYR